MTSTVFSCPTKLMSCFHSKRWMIAAVKACEFIALLEAMKAPSGDQLASQYTVSARELRQSKRPREGRT